MNQNTNTTSTVVEHKARMPHPAFLLEGGIDALTGVNRIAQSSGLPDALLQLVSTAHGRASCRAV